MSTKKQLQIVGNPELSTFENQIGQIPFEKTKIANKLKNMTLFSLLVFEKNHVNDIVSVAFSGTEDEAFSVTNAMSNQFQNLKVPVGAVIACNFPVDLINVKTIFEADISVQISGIICPRIDEQAAGFLLTRNENCFIFTDSILSPKREKEEFTKILISNDSIIPKLFSDSGLKYPELTIRKALELF